MRRYLSGYRFEHQHTRTHSHTHKRTRHHDHHSPSAPYRTLMRTDRQPHRCETDLHACAQRPAHRICESIYVHVRVGRQLMNKPKRPRANLGAERQRLHRHMEEPLHIPGCRVNDGVITRQPRLCACMLGRERAGQRYMLARSAGGRKCEVSPH